MSNVILGSRVYYKDTGPEDTGTIVDILLDDYPFVVKWDRQEESRYLEKHISLLGIDHIHIYNPADENVDQFKGSQLVLIEDS